MISSKVRLRLAAIVSLGNNIRSAGENNCLITLVFKQTTELVLLPLLPKAHQFSLVACASHRISESFGRVRTGLFVVSFRKSSEKGMMSVMPAVTN